jgi:hypothetical protein
VVVTRANFNASLSNPAPPRELAAPLAALWWAKKGDWEKAHRIVMDETDKDAAWVHAYLHRVEGDTGNAKYWYAQARKPGANGDLDAEWAALVEVLLQPAEKRTK